MTEPASDGHQTAAKGISCMVVGCAFLMMSDAFSKWLTQTYSVGQVMSLRNVFVLIPLFLIVWHKNNFNELRVHSWKAQLFRAIFHVAPAIFFVTSVSLLPLADVHAIGFAGPIFIAALSPLMLGEHVGWHRWTAILVGFGGVLIMLRPTGTGFALVGLLPLAAALSSSFRDIITRRLSRTETSTSMLFVSSAAVVVAGACTLPIDWRPLTWTSLLLFIGNGLVNACAHFLIIESYRLAQAPVVSPFKYSILLWATLFGYMIWGNVPDRWIIIGAIPVVASGLYILHREQRLAAARRRAAAS
jgi:drug/metabolite transporter (DMT)-like permease